jgi:putative SOS response-associated peptidase YedK
MEDNHKQPYYISLKSDEPMAFAGLWDAWKIPDGGTLQSSCIVTTNANELMRPIHERMPVIVTENDWQGWLGRQMMQPS